MSDKSITVNYHGTMYVSDCTVHTVIHYLTETNKILLRSNFTHNFNFFSQVPQL